jgi:protein-tyrosine phosphatase
MDAVAQRYGSDYAHLLCVTNPLAAFTGNTLPHRMEPRRLYDDFNEKSWWQKLLSKP